MSDRPPGRFERDLEADVHSQAAAIIAGLSGVCRVAASGGVAMAQARESDILRAPLSRVGDEELVACARQGSWRAVEHLLRRHRMLVEGKASAYFLAGGEHDDVVQEGMIGLFKAIRDFSGEHLCGFRSFAELCITRQIISAVKTATRQKHAALNRYVSVDVPVGDGEEARALGETLPEGRQRGPEEAVVGHAIHRELRKRIGDELSELEARALLRYVDGQSYHDIATEFGLGVKQVDNALQRAKKKLASVMADSASA